MNTFDLTQLESLSLATTGHAVLLRRIEPQPPKGFEDPDDDGNGLWAWVRVRKTNEWHDVRCPFTIGEQVECRERWGISMAIRFRPFITAVSAEGVEGTWMWRVSVEVRA